MAVGRDSDATELDPRAPRPSSIPPTVADTGGPTIAGSLPPPPLLGENELIGGRYRVLGLLGQGGFSEVYRVEDTRGDKRSLALKLHRIGDLHGFALASLKTEFALLASLSHPNLAPVHDFGWASDRVAFFTQGIAEGVRFDQIGVPLASPRGVMLVAQLCRALDYLHARGILHRDVKPGNVLVDLARDHLTLLDFGVSRTFGAIEAGVVVGTHAYLAPETVRGGPVDARADLYALGITLYRLVTGTLPFRGGDVLVQHLFDLPPPIPPEKCPPEVAAVVLRLLRKEPAERYASAGEACVALAQAVGAEVEIETRETLSGYVLSGRFVGREDEATALASRATAVESRETDPGRAVLIVGAEGTGKSRLLREVRQRVQVAGKAWVSAEVARDDAGAGLLAEIAADVITPDVAAGLSNDDRLELARALPRLRRRGEHLALAVDPDGARVRRTEALARALSLRFAARPGVLAIDNLHRASPEVVRSIATVVTRLLTSRAGPLVMLAGRPSRAMEELAATLAHDRLATAALDPPLIARLVSSMFGQEELLAGTALGTALDRGRHTPLRVQESLRLAIDEGAIVRREGRWTLVRDVPAISLDAVLRARVRRLDARERALTLALAVIGRPAPLAEVARVAALRPDVAHDVLPALVASGIVERHDDARGHSTFGLPERFADLVLAERAGTPVRSAQLRAARSLLSRRDAAGTPDHRALARASRHLEDAGRPIEAARVAERAALAADQAGRPDLAVSLLGRALEVDTGHSRHIARLLARHDHALRAGLGRVADETRRALSRHADEASRAEAVEIDLRLAQHDTRAGKPTAARRRVRKALAAARQLGLTRVECALVLLGAQLESDFGRFGHAVDALLDAARLAEGRGERDLEARAYLACVLAAVHSGARDLALDAARRAVRAAHATRDLTLRSQAERQLGNALLQRGALRAAVAAYRRAVQEARASGSIEDEAKALNNLGTTAQHAGAVDEALAALRRAAMLKDRSGALVSGSVTHNNLGLLLCALGDHERAEQELRRGIDAPHTLPRIVASLLEILGDLRLVQRRDDEAVACYERSVALAREQGNAWQEAQLVACLIRAYVARGDVTRARTLRDSHDDIARSVDSLEAKRRFLVADTILLAAEGKLTEAITSAREAVNLPGTPVQFLGPIGSTLEARWLLAVLLARAGRRTAALKSARSAATLLDRHTARLHSAAARETWLRAHPLHVAITNGATDLAHAEWPPGVAPLGQERH